MAQWGFGTCCRRQARTDHPAVAQSSSNAHNLAAKTGGNQEAEEGPLWRTNHAPTNRPIASTRPRGAGREPDEEAIRERAHAIWLSEGMPEGREVDHWMRARRELEHEAGHK